MDTTQHLSIHPPDQMDGQQSDALNLFAQKVVGAHLESKHCVHRVHDYFFYSLISSINYYLCTFFVSKLLVFVRVLSGV